ncbi:hypothetical protein [Flaviaesturariibacter aridisoli]|uniref:PH domain-containing protein n=1 Tax=Flaviaesturariibacter aridisoli TaxID=2545761 RepID=A0A4R4E2U1_9BACT|nr:hypothetical protein [Flaviaesturariibacter aridisoli]TCZ73719.1 hypothetical protein E0486_05400 [Flaviaesturariibacter aridisoli]
MSTLIEIKTKRWQSLLLLPFILGLMIVSYWFVLGPGARPDDPPPPIAKIVVYLLQVVGAFLCAYFLRMTLKPKTVLRVDDKGFVMDTGISTNLIRWEETRCVTEKLVAVAGTAGVHRRELVLAIYLKDPERFRCPYHLLLRGLLAASEQLRGASILIPATYLGRNYEAFKTLAARRTGLPVVPET